jgi:hypothetical protein
MWKLPTTALMLITAFFAADARVAAQAGSNQPATTLVDDDGVYDRDDDYGDVDDDRPDSYGNFDDDDDDDDGDEPEFGSRDDDGWSGSGRDAGTRT